MNRKTFFKIFLTLILIVISTYLIFATGYGGSFESKDPTNNSNLSIKTPGGLQFYNFTCRNLSVGSFDPALANITSISLWADFNGTFSLNRSNASAVIGNETEIGFNITQVADGTYTWGCKIVLSNGTTDWTINRTVTIDINNPSIVNNITNNSGLVWFNNNTGKPTSAGAWSLPTPTLTDATMVNCSAYDDFDGTWGRNTTNTTANISGGAIFEIINAGVNYIPNIAINSSGYRYTVSCVDSVNHTMNATNPPITIRVDGVAPYGSISVANSTAVVSDDTWTNWSDETWNASAIAQDVGGSISNCSLWGDFSGSWGKNQTVSVSNFTNFDFTPLTLETKIIGYKYIVECKDKANNRRNLSLGTLLIKVDAGSPSAVISSSAGTLLGLSQSTTLSCTTSEDVSIKSTTIAIDGTTICTGTGSCSGSYLMATSSSKTATCTAGDNFNHTGISSLTITTSEGGGTGGGGGGGGGASGKVWDIDFSEVRIGTLSGKEGTQKTFTLDGSIGHTIEFSKIRATSILLIVKSDPINVDLVIGQSRKIDIDNDGIGDIKIALKSILNGEAQIETEDITSLKIIVTEPMGEGSIIPLTINRETYNLEIESVGIASTTITLAGQTLDLVIGETVQVDLNNDGTNDIEITLNSLADKKPQFTIKEIPLQAAPEETVTGEEVIVAKEGISKTTIGLIVLGIVIIIALILYLVERKR